MDPAKLNGLGVKLALTSISAGLIDRLVPSDALVRELVLAFLGEALGSDGLPQLGAPLRTGKSADAQSLARALASLGTARGQAWRGLAMLRVLAGGLTLSAHMAWLEGKADLLRQLIDELDQNPGQG